MTIEDLAGLIDPSYCVSIGCGIIIVGDEPGWLWLAYSMLNARGIWS